MLLLAPTLTPLHVRSCSSRSTAWSCTARCGWRSREPRPATSWRRTQITRRDGRILGLTSPCRHFFSCRAARASASRAPTDTACAGASGPSRRRSSSVPPAGARIYREGRGGERSRRGVSCVRRRRRRRPAGCGIRLRSATRRSACWRGPRPSRPSEGHRGRMRECDPRWSRGQPTRRLGGDVHDQSSRRAAEFASLSGDDERDRESAVGSAEEAGQCLPLARRGDDLVLGRVSVPTDREELSQDHRLPRSVDFGRNPRPHEYSYRLSEGESGVR